MSDIIEALRKRVVNFRRMHCNLGYYSEGDALLDERAADALAAVTPLIRAAALEEAAAFFETYGEDYPSEGDWLMRGDVAAQLRALKEQP